MRYLFAVMLALSILSPGVALAGEDLRAIKSVAIVSTISNVMHLVRHGVRDVQIADWGLNEEVESKLRTLLSKRFEVLQPSKLSENLAGCLPCADLLPKTSDVDAYILVSTGITRSGLMTEAMGIEMDYHSMVWSKDKAAVFAIYDLSVIDARTGRVFAREQGMLPDVFSWGEHYKPVMDMDGSVWPRDDQDMTADQKRTVHDAVFGMMDRSLPFMVQYMKLG